MASYLDKPEEVIGMFSDALRILDENTARYMIELKDEEIAEKTSYLLRRTTSLLRRML